MNSNPDLRLDWANAKQARYACRLWHYSRTLPTAPYNTVGVWEGGRFIGIVLFSRGNCPSIGKPFGLEQTEICELTRIALREHRTPVTRIIRIALTFLARRSPGLRMVVSYADPNQNHHGGIYQGAGWLFLGQTPESEEFISPSGKRIHARKVSVSGTVIMPSGRVRAFRPNQCSRRMLPGKYKYAKVLNAGDSLHAMLAPKAEPYPKRVESFSGGTGGSQPHGDGSIPISTLQSKSGVALA